MFTTGWRFRMKFPDKIFHTFVMLDMSGGPCQTPTPFVTSKIIKNSKNYRSDGSESSNSALFQFYTIPILHSSNLTL